MHAHCQPVLWLFKQKVGNCWQSCFVYQSLKMLNLFIDIGVHQKLLIISRCGHICVKSPSFLHHVCLCAVSVHTPSDRRN